MPLLIDTVASLLARLQFKHFGHSENINKNEYQAAAGSMQLQTTGQTAAGGLFFR